jgi:hypothetical protein
MDQIALPSSTIALSPDRVKAEHDRLGEGVKRQGEHANLIVAGRQADWDEMASDGVADHRVITRYAHQPSPLGLTHDRLSVWWPHPNLDVDVPEVVWAGTNSDAARRRNNICFPNAPVWVVGVGRIAELHLCVVRVNTLSC